MLLLLHQISAVLSPSLSVSIALSALSFSQVGLCYWSLRARFPWKQPDWLVCDVERGGLSPLPLWSLAGLPGTREGPSVKVTPLQRPLRPWSHERGWCSCRSTSSDPVGGRLSVIRLRSTCNDAVIAHRQTDRQTDSGGGAPRGQTEFPSLHSASGKTRGLNIQSGRFGA